VRACESAVAGEESEAMKQEEFADREGAIAAQNYSNW
jgi:hypothetical protein